jgi:HicB family
MSNFPLRLPKDLMEDAKVIAKDQGVSVNQFLATVLAERVGEMKAMSRLRHRATMGDSATAQAILRRAPDVAPMVGDEFAASDS